MKRILSIFCLSIFSYLGFAQESNLFEDNKAIIREFVANYHNDKDVKIIEIGSAMTSMLSEKLMENDNYSSAKLLRSIESITIVVDKNICDQQLESSMFDLPNRCKGYKLISSLNEDGNYSGFYFASHEQIKKCEFLMVVKKDNRDLLLYIIGEFSVKDISALSELSILSHID